MYDEEMEFIDLPDEVFSNEEYTEINNDWLESASDEDKIKAMKKWFLSNYYDPVVNLPYITEEGGYQWIYGGPYEARDELDDRFYSLVDYQLIDKAAIEIEDFGYEWAKWSDYNDSHDEDHLEFMAELELTKTPIYKLRDNIQDIRKLIENNNQKIVLNMSYSWIITLLEAFMWERIQFLLKEIPEVTQHIVKNWDELSKRSLTLKEIFERNENLSNEIKYALSSKLVWHRWNEVKELLIDGLGLDTKNIDFKPLKEKTNMRHHIIHRAGQDVDGNEITVSTDDIKELCSIVENIANSIENAINSKWRVEPKNDS